MKSKIKYVPVVFLVMIGSVVVGQIGVNPNHDSNQIINRYIHLPPQELFDTASHYYRQNDIDEALTLFGLVTSMAPQYYCPSHQRLVIEAYIRSANIHYHLSRFRTAYELLLLALQQAENDADIINQSRIYISLGLIYHRIGKQDVAIRYFQEALKSGENRALILNNIGYVNVLSGNLDQANYFLNQSLHLANMEQGQVLHFVLHSLAAYYRARKNYDKAHYYYKLSLTEARRGHTRQHKRVEAVVLSGLGQLYFELNNLYSAIVYLYQSNLVATENGLLDIQMENYLILSNIAQHRGNKTVAFDYFRRYYDLRDSVWSSVNIAEIGELRRRHEISRASQQILQLTIEQQIKAQTIRYQRNLTIIISTVLVLISALLVFVFVQYRKLSTAYKKLFEKDVKLVEYEHIHLKESRKTILADKVADKLIAQIYTIMEDTAVICDTEFTLDKLADLVGSNRVRVSQVINNDLKKNFRTFINEYRVREAQRLFSEPDAAKYTVEFVALNVGFKSRTSFIAAFKETTGVTPSFYLKALQKKQQAIVES